MQATRSPNRVTRAIGYSNTKQPHQHKHLKSVVLGCSLTAGRECWVDTEAFLAAASDGRELLADRPAEALASFRDALKLWHGEPLAEDTYAEWV